MTKHDQWEYVNVDKGIGRMPKKQQKVLIYSPDPLIGGIGIGRYDGSGYWKIAEIEMLMTIQVTHWRPLPSPPSNMNDVEIRDNSVDINPPPTSIDFFEWLYYQVESQTYLINHNSKLFIVEYQGKKHLAIMSPIVFATYAKAKGYVESIDSRKKMIEAACVIQNILHDEKINVSIAGRQIHTK